MIPEKINLLDEIFKNKIQLVIRPIEGHTDDTVLLSVATQGYVLNQKLNLKTFDYLQDPEIGLVATISQQIDILLADIKRGTAKKYVGN